MYGQDLPKKKLVAIGNPLMRRFEFIRMNSDQIIKDLPEARARTNYAEVGEETPAPLTKYHLTHISRTKPTLAFVGCRHLRTEDLLHNIVASVH